jgi:hypothetical protein
MAEISGGLLEDLRDMADGCRFAAVRRFSPGAYQRLPEEEAKLLYCVLDFAELTATSEPVFADIRSAAYQAFVVAYVEGRRVDPDAGDAFYRSLSEDYPGAEGSALLHSWASLTTATLAFREVGSDASQMTWQKCVELFEATSAFLSGLLPFLITLRRATRGMEPLGAAAFDLSFAELVRDYAALIRDDGGPLGVFTTLCEPGVFEALAQARAQPDAEEGVLRYVEDADETQERRFDLASFFLVGAAGSHLQHAYLAAVSAIAVMESGSPASQALFPPALASAFSHGREPPSEEGRGKQ